MEGKKYLGRMYRSAILDGTWPLQICQSGITWEGKENEHGVANSEACVDDVELVAMEF